MNARPRANGSADVMLDVKNLRAYYVMKYFGTQREIRAVDDISLQVGRNEIYGLAGEFEFRQDYLHQDHRRGDPPAAHRRRRLHPLQLPGP